MHINDLSAQDVFVNVHGYEKWDKGLTKEPIENIVEDFPGEIFGVAEEGFGDELHGRENIPDENIIQSRPQQGRFDRRGLGIKDADYVVMAGGEYGLCHHGAYEIMRNEADDAEFIFPPEACFGWYKCSKPEFMGYRLDELHNGTLPVSDQQYFSQKIIEERGENEKMGEYDWKTSSIQDVEVG